MPVMKNPNIIIILADDLGYGDLSCLGNTDFATPNLDTIAKDGIRFSSFYSNAPVCSPSRASLLTGLYPINAGVRDIVQGHRTATGIDPNVPTLAEILKQHNYHTFISGKWHIGLEKDSRPLDKGFDRFHGILSGCIDYYSHIFYYGISDGRFNPVHDLWLDNKEIWQNGEYMTELITQNACNFITDACGTGKPFFGYIAYNAPHYPMHAPKKYIDRFKGLSPDRRIMAAMISAMDDGIGQIIKQLKDKGIYEDTIIFFMSDNGPSRESRNWLDGNPDYYYGGSTGKLKGHKFSLFEGGIRVPALISYPTKIPAGTENNQPIAAMDMAPTLLKMAGLENDNQFDGINLSDVILGKSETPDRDICWEMGQQLAIRRDNYKLVLNGQLVENEKPVEEKVFLSDMKNDIAEQNNLKDTYPNIVEQMQKSAQNWLKNMLNTWENVHLPRYNGTTGYTG